MILDLIDQRLRVFDAHAHREGFGFQSDFLSKQQLVDVTCGMAGGQDHGTGFKGVAALRGHAENALVADHETIGACAEEDIAACLPDGAAQARDDGGQAVGTDVRMGFVQNRLRCAVGVEQLHRAAVVAAFFRTRVKFAVGKSASATFAETVVGLGVERVLTVDQGDVTFSFTDLLAAFKHNRLEAAFDQAERRKEACRAGADHEHGITVRHIGKIKLCRRNNRSRLIRHDLYAQVDDQMPASGIYRSTHDTEIRDTVWGDA